VLIVLNLYNDKVFFQNYHTASSRGVSFRSAENEFP
jgi:hypothetical protein